MSKIYKTVIIGCGAIAGGYDSLQNKDILTHAHAISLHKRTALNGVYDILYKKAVIFAKKWRSRAYFSLNTLFKEIKPDIVYICVPDDKHTEVLQTVLQYRPRIVVCEKPLGVDVKSANKIVRDYKKQRVGLTVNYIRRFDTAISDIKYHLLRGDYGQFINGSIIYTKGILHNGSHAIDLLHYLFGEITSFKILKRTNDYLKADPTLDAFLEFNNIAIHLIAGNERQYSIFEADFLFNKARIRLEEFGFKIIRQNIRLDPIFSGHKDLGKRIIKYTSLNTALLNLVNNVVGYLDKKEKLLCSGEEALITQETCFKLLEK